MRSVRSGDPLWDASRQPAPFEALQLPLSAIDLRSDTLHADAVNDNVRAAVAVVDPPTSARLAEDVPRGWREGCILSLVSRPRHDLLYTGVLLNWQEKPVPGRGAQSWFWDHPGRFSCQPECTPA